MSVLLSFRLERCAASRTDSNKPCRAQTRVMQLSEGYLIQKRVFYFVFDRLEPLTLMERLELRRGLCRY